MAMANLQTYSHPYGGHLMMDAHYVHSCAVELRRLLENLQDYHTLPAAQDVGDTQSEVDAMEGGSGAGGRRYYGYGGEEYMGEEGEVEDEESYDSVVSVREEDELRKRKTKKKIKKNGGPELGVHELARLRASQTQYI